MNTISKIFVTIILISLISIISFLSGELIGMKSGYAHTLKTTSPMEAAYTVSIINLLENNMHKEAKEMLETKLDNYIINHWSGNQCKLISLNPFLKEKPNNELFYSTITHRKAIPSDNETIQNHLKNIEKAM